MSFVFKRLMNKRINGYSHSVLNARSIASVFAVPQSKGVFSSGTTSNDLEYFVSEYSFYSGTHMGDTKHVEFKDAGTIDKFGVVTTASTTRPHTTVTNTAANMEFTIPLYKKTASQIAQCVFFNTNTIIKTWDNRDCAVLEETTSHVKW
jgi:hypothetical protein